MGVSQSKISCGKDMFINTLPDPVGMGWAGCVGFLFVILGIERDGTEGLGWYTQEKRCERMGHKQGMEWYTQHNMHKYNASFRISIPSGIRENEKSL